jgi:dTDP-4-amino-4,6-dideoxygalactose transaminase
MNVPLLDLKAQHEPLHDQILGAVSRVIHSQEFIMGREVTTLEESVAAYCNAKFGIGVSSGTDALLVALMALGIKPGDEVITPPFSFFATAGVVSRLGATPVFADIDAVTFNLDPARIEERITSRTAAIIPVHLYGQVADMDPIMEISHRRGIPVVEDGAQAIGAEYRDGRRACSMTEIGCLSFFPSKNLGAMGDAGMVVTSDQKLAEKLRILRVHGGKPKYYHQVIGGNFRLDAMQAAVLNVKLAHLDDWTAGRQRNAQRYERLFEEHGVKNVELPKAVYKDSGVRHYHIYNQFVIRSANRDALREHLKQNGVSTEIYYPVPFHLQKCFEPLGYKEGDFPHSEKASRETLALPIYPELTEEQQRHVVQTIGSFGGE